MESTTYNNCDVKMFEYHTFFLPLTKVTHISTTLDISCKAAEQFHTELQWRWGGGGGGGRGGGGGGWNKSLFEWLRSHEQAGCHTNIQNQMCMTIKLGIQHSSHIG